MLEIILLLFCGMVVIKYTWPFLLIGGILYYGVPYVAKHISEYGFSIPWSLLDYWWAFIGGFFLLCWLIELLGGWLQDAGNGFKSSHSGSSSPNLGSSSYNSSDYSSTLSDHANRSSDG